MFAASGIQFALRLCGGQYAVLGCDFDHWNPGRVVVASGELASPVGCAQPAATRFKDRFDRRSFALVSKDSPIGYER
jgi:hypothetical protein